ncbi:MAG: HAD hydrolase-like protein [Actinomycetes bacterium]
MGAIKLVVFDVAGTTATDDGLVVKAFMEAMIEQGATRNSEELGRMVAYVEETMGQRKMDVFMHLCNGDVSAAEETHENFIEQYNTLVSSGELAEFDGISQLFATLRANNIGVAITTGFPRQLLSAILNDLEWRDRIDLSVASDEVAAGRPAPDMIMRSIDLYRNLSNEEIEPNNVIVVGDTASDMQSGVLAGARYIVGVTSGAHDIDQLKSAGATHILSSATELLTLVNL